MTLMSFLLDTSQKMSCDLSPKAHRNVVENVKFLVRIVIVIFDRSKDVRIMRTSKFHIK